MALPVAYLVIRAMQADSQQAMDLVFRWRNLELLLNTLSLTAGVLALSTAVSYPLAWVTARTDLPFRKTVTTLSILPLAIPGYVMAYTLLSLGGANGTIAQLFGVELPRISGYLGALLSVSFYTFPYLYLNLRAGFMGLDPAQEEAARSLGHNTRQIFFNVWLPHLKPAYLSGALIISLYVLGDFGAVSLMRYETISVALFTQYAGSYDRIYAAWLALMLIALTATLLFAEARILKGVRLSRVGTGAMRHRSSSLGTWKGFILAGIGLLVLSSLVVPMGTVLFWMSKGSAHATWTDVLYAVWNSTQASAPAAALACMLAIPLAYVSVRYPSPTSSFFERVAWFGFATPPLALGLAFIFFSLSLAPGLYQTISLLVLAYAIHFLAEALGPIRSALYQAPPRLEEAARSLGFAPFQAFRKATLPLLRNGSIAGAAFVFLSAMKELPITIILAPVGFESLAMNVWGYTNEAMFADAAPFALILLLLSSLFVGLLFTREIKP